MTTISSTSLAGFSPVLPHGSASEAHGADAIPGGLALPRSPLDALSGSPRLHEAADAPSTIDEAMPDADVHHGPTWAMFGAGGGPTGGGGQAGGANVTSSKAVREAAERRHEQKINELASLPYLARDAWSGLSVVDRNLVVLQMAAKYGEGFAREFLKQLGTRSAGPDVGHYYGPGVGPKPERLLELGYKLAQKDSVQEWWVHPSGKSVTRNSTEDVPTPAPSPRPSETRPTTQKCKDAEVLSTAICDNAEKICNIATELGDADARASCDKARNSCDSGKSITTTCVEEEKH